MQDKIECTNNLGSNGNPAGGAVRGVGLSIDWQNGPLGRGEDLSIMPIRHNIHTCEERSYCDACEWDLEAAREGKDGT